MTENKRTWKHSNTVLDGKPCSINGLNIWDYQWKDTLERINVKDPLYGKDFTFAVYEVTNGTTTGRFAAGEFSNNVWGIYEERH